MLDVRPHFEEPIELRLGLTDETSVCYLVRAGQPDRGGDPYIVCQPDVMQEDLRMGWAAFGDHDYKSVLLGRFESPQFRLGPDIGLLHVSVSLLPGKAISICCFSENGMYVTVNPADLGPSSLTALREA